MPTYLHPGVYIEEIPSGSRPIEAVSTSTAAFIGYTSRGPMNTPTRLSKWDEYERIFGGLEPANDGSKDHWEMGASLRAFFLNGGGSAYIVRLAMEAAKATKASVNTSIFAIDEGAWANGLIFAVNIEANGEATVTIEREQTIGGKPKKIVLERFVGSADAAKPDFVGHRVNSGSGLVRVAVEGAPEWTTANLVLADGSDGQAPKAEAYAAAFAGLVKNREISIICLPGQHWGNGKAIIEQAIAHAELTRNRMVLVDPAPSTELTTPTQVEALELPTSTYCVLYYPWVAVANPTYDPERNPGVDRTLMVAPSSFAAGMFAKIDGRRGVWKAPAGVETALLGVVKLEYPVDDADQDVLNPLGVNCLRTMPGFGNVIWGARTLATKADPEWRYVPIRRTAIMIEQSIYNNIQWAVFEPNNEMLWSSLRVNIGSFMDGLFRSGAFQGGTANDAYFVRCGLGDTMTQADIDRGQVIVIVGFAPLKPAEFVIVRIQQKLAKQ